jgi:hypothetical protein
MTGKMMICGVATALALSTAPAAHGATKYCTVVCSVEVPVGRENTELDKPKDGLCVALCANDLKGCEAIMETVPLQPQLKLRTDGVCGMTFDTRIDAAIHAISTAGIHLAARKQEYCCDFLMELGPSLSRFRFLSLIECEKARRILQQRLGERTRQCSIGSAERLTQKLGSQHWWDPRVDVAEHAITAAGIRIADRKDEDWCCRIAVQLGSSNAGFRFFTLADCKKARKVLQKLGERPGECQTGQP